MGSDISKVPSHIIKHTIDNDFCYSSSVHRIHPEKKGFRVLGIAESFRRPVKKSVLVGAVMRKDLIIDGVVTGSATIEGDDATDSVVNMINGLRRNDINCIMLGGLIISMYNIIDSNQILLRTGIPVIAVTYNESKGIEQILINRFHPNANTKLDSYSGLGQRREVTLRTGSSVYVRFVGLSLKHAILILNSFTLQGSIPEPIRVAKLMARAYLS